MLALPTELVTVLAVGTDPITDELGNVIPGSGEMEEIDLLAAVMPSRTNEVRDLATREQVVTAYRVYFDGRAMVAATSRLRWRGLVLEIVGDPEWWPDGLGGIDHTELTAVVARG